MGYTTLRKYAVPLDDSTAGSRKLSFLPYKVGTNVFATSSDWTPAVGDFKVAKAVTGSGLGTEASIGTAPTWVNGRVVIILSGTELTCRYATIRIENAAINSEEILVETYGNASAEYTGDFNDAVRQGLTSLPNSASTINGLLANVNAINGSQNAAQCAQASYEGFQGTYGGASQTNNFDLGSLLTQNLLGLTIEFKSSGNTVKGWGIINSQTNAATTTVSIHVATGVNVVSGDNWFITPRYSPAVDTTNARANAQVKGIDASQITATSIATSALNGKGDWPLNTDYTVARAGKLDNLDAAVTTRLASGNVTVGGFAAGAITAAAIANGAFNGKGDWVLASSYTAPDNATIAAIAGYVDTEVAAIKLVTDHLATGLETADAGAHYRFTTAALVNAPAGGGGGGGFVGAYSVTLVFHDAGGSAVPGVAFTVVGVGSAQAGTGQITVGLDAGTYTVRAAPVAGVMWADASITVAGSGSFTITGTAATLPAASAPGYVTGYIDLYGGAGALAPGARLELRRVDVDALTGQSFVRKSWNEVADASGRVAVSLQASTDFQARRDGGDWVAFTSASSGVFALPAVLGPA